MHVDLDALPISSLAFDAGATHDHRLTSQFRAAQLLDRGVKGIEIDMHHDPLHGPILGAL